MGNSAHGQRPDSHVGVCAGQAGVRQNPGDTGLHATWRQSGVQPAMPGQRRDFARDREELAEQDVRVATSVLKNVAPQPGRKLISGVRTNF